MVNINWAAIRLLNGSQRDAFEELSAQIAGNEMPSDASFVRTGNPDSGVECYCVLANGDEWGWQAKYFLQSPTPGQWGQIDDSVEKALRGHPKLKRYVVCMPVDLPDGRRPKTTTARQHWDQRVQKWQNWAQQKDMSVDFELWDSSTLISSLTRPENAGMLRYWFDQSGFDKDWFRIRLNEAQNAAGPRYTPEVHVSTQVQATNDLEMFARTEVGINRIKSLAVEIRRVAQYMSQTEQERLASKHRAPFPDLITSVESALQKLSALQYEPTGEYPFNEIVTNLDAALEAAGQIEAKLKQLVSEEYEQDHNRYASSNNRSALNSIYRISSEVRQARTELKRAIKFTNTNLIVLTGRAGVGKTHLLCDFAERHLNSGTPVVLLMGQRFTSTDDPMRQIITQLDHPQGGTFEEIVGALECAAKVARRRGLIIIDAINEGQGHRLWNPHLSTLVDRATKSPWLGLLLSVREEYMKNVVPDQVSRRAATITHYGFEGIEFDAVKTFFEYYNLELPSTPILQPEFSNPLWLKIICEGLQNAGYSRMPRGYGGITKTLELFTKAVNQKLAKPDALDYDEADNLVQHAIGELAGRMVSDDTSWVNREDAKAVVNQLLPNRHFSNSLYYRLVTEGLLTELAGLQDNDDFVVFAYERIADHLKVNCLLNGLDNEAPESAFEQGGPLAFVRNDKYVPEGIIGALSIQLPERTGQELAELVPELKERFDEETFSQSIVWRAPDAVTETTKRIISDLVKRKIHWNPVLDAVLTVAVVPDHPLNAEYLDHLLRSSKIGERDAWWTVHLHRSWDDDRPIYRLIEWALSEKANDLSEQVAELAMIALTWLLTSSNRFVRDRATKALVNLSDRRLTTAERMVKRFADVDDPYVAERVYAVAYGVAMRSNDPEVVGRLAILVYNLVFAQGAPQPHILLRDYARGVIERADYLGANLGNVKFKLTKPPYKSQWPEIPSENKIQALHVAMEQKAGESDWAKGSWWAINGSVLTWGDFARYTIGTNSSSQSRDWLTTTLNEEPWLSREQREADLSSQLSEKELKALTNYNETIQAARTFPTLIIMPTLDDDGQASEGALPQILHRAGEHIVAHLVSRIKTAMARGQLVAALSEEHLSKWRMLHEAEPRLDLSIIQRYILNRVVELGWNIERFGEFDQFINMRHSAGRQGHKPERIGKKYQWIAYHEILAFISDRHRYHPQWESTSQYEGPWQLGLRDIDPSTAAAPTRSGADSTEEYPSTWWDPMEYDNWQPSTTTEQWIADEGDIPALDDGLLVENPEEPGVHWFNALGFQIKQQPHPADTDKYDIESREVWLRAAAYLVPRGQGDNFIEWVTSGEYRTNDWAAPNLDIGLTFLGEHGWRQIPTLQGKEDEQNSNEWQYPKVGTTPEAQALVATCLTGSSEYDCSVDEKGGIRLYLPSPSIIEGCQLRWNGDKADFLDLNDTVAALDPSAHETGRNALLIRTDTLQRYMDANELDLCWAVIGEKQTIGTTGQPYGWLNIFGAYVYQDGKLVGKHRCEFNDPHPQER